MKYIGLVLIFLGIFSETYSTEYLHFGGNQEESKQAEYYLSVDSGTNTGPTDELRRTQRSFWKFLKHGLFGGCGNCCNNCHLNVRNGNICNSGNALLHPLHSWHPLPLWRPLEPLFGTNSYGCESSDNFGNPPSYSTNTYSDPNINPTYNYENNESPAPAYEAPTELPTELPDYQLENRPGSEDTFAPPSGSLVQTYSNNENSKDAQKENKKLPQIIYQPIIYVSPQYQESKPLNQIKQDEMKYSELSKLEHRHLPNFEVTKDESHQSLYNQNVDESKLNDKNSYKPKVPESDVSGEATPFGHQSPCTDSICQNVNYPSTNPSVSSVSTVYNIITPSLLQPLATSNGPCSDGGPSKYSLYPLNNIPLGNNPSSTQTSIESESDYIKVTPTTESYMIPILLTQDDQPFRDCPELFKDYQRKLSTFSPTSPY